MRICSFLPSATEMLYALGLGDSVAGVSFECDYPPEARSKTVVVRTRLSHCDSSAAAIDREVREFQTRGESLYQVDAQALAQIQPDLVLTQDLCHVCAASPNDLGPALAALCPPPQLVSLSPQTLADVWNDVRLVGRAAGRAAEAEVLASQLEERVRGITALVAGVARPRVLCLEWTDPPFIAGHWIPEMVACAGGVDVLGRAGEPGFSSAWPPLLQTRAEVVVVMPCGYDLKRTCDEFRHMALPRDWDHLPAVRDGRVFAVDPSSYFSRPGPRLADGVAILAHLLHPDRVPAPPLAESFQQL